MDGMTAALNIWFGLMAWIILVVSWSSISEWFKGLAYDLWDGIDYRRYLKREAAAAKVRAEKLAAEEARKAETAAKRAASRNANARKKTTPRKRNKPKAPVYTKPTLVVDNTRDIVA